MSTNITQPSEFGSLFQELLAARSHYESLRISGAPFAERADMLDRLHGLRHDMGMIRRSSR